MSVQWEVTKYLYKLNDWIIKNKFFMYDYHTNTIERVPYFCLECFSVVKVT